LQISHSPTSFEIEYLFIDGAYLRGICNEYMQALFGVDADLDLITVKNSFSPRKVFYYDCLDDVPRPQEPAADISSRVNQQQERFDKINSLPGFHVRLGTVAGKKPGKLRQKEIDVQLAVDMLTHAFGQNMTRATLLSGDLDFRPVVSALVSLGMWVNVAGKASSASKELYRAADAVREITIFEAHQWNVALFKESHPLPRLEHRRKFQMEPHMQITRAGTVNGLEVKVISGLTVVFNHNGNDILINETEAFAERFLTAYLGPPSWQ
jgi:uncharacterized LabA/DUF88 family protein